MNRSFWVSLFVGISVLTGCTHFPCRNCTFEQKVSRPVISSIPFSDTGSVLYRVSIRLYSMYFSGLLAVKRIENDHFRMSLISETGFKLFDMEIKDGVSEMVNIFSELDREEVVRTFKEDFAFMVLGIFKKESCNKYIYEKNSDVLYECSINPKNTVNYLLESKNGTLKKVWKAEDINEPLFEINYGYGEKGSLTPIFITIVHMNVRLRMEFSLLEQEDVHQ